MEVNRQAKFRIGQVVRHRFYPFRGVIFDVDPTFNNTEEWWLSIPEEVRPRKDQPYYAAGRHLCHPRKIRALTRASMLIRCADTAWSGG